MWKPPKTAKMFKKQGFGACFGAAPAPGIFYPEPAPGKREHNFGFF